MTLIAPCRWDDDRGSLVMAMLLTMVGVSLAAVLSPVVVVQIASSRSETRRGHALNAAQAGLDVLVAQIRAADDGIGNGVRASLPCGPLTGAVGGGPDETFRVTVFYVAFDPQSQMAASPTWFAANDIDCTAGSGPTTLPAFAVAFSTGTEVGSTRTVRGAYRLRTTNQHIAGGPIGIFYDNLCMDGGTITPVAGTALEMRTCSATRKEQVFAYHPNYTLQLVNSVTAAEPTGMCLDAGSPQAEGSLVRFEPCASPVTARQQWQYNGRSQFEGMNAAGSTNGFLFRLTAPGVNGSTVEITKNVVWTGTFSHDNSFLPDAKAGAGNAGPQFKQLVNFALFGRCLDLNGGNYQNALIAWPCKPSWNQAYDLPPLATDPATAVPGKITLTVPVGKPATPPGLYCLRSPRSTANWSFPKLVECPAVDTPDLEWRVHGLTDSYSTSYQILDVNGNCLQPADPNTSPEYFDVGSIRVSMVVTRACSDSLLQKWNADPNILAGLSLKYLGE